MPEEAPEDEVEEPWRLWAANIVANEKAHHIAYFNFILLDEPHNNDFTKVCFKPKLLEPENTQET